MLLIHVKIKATISKYSTDSRLILKCYQFTVEVDKNVELVSDYRVKFPLVEMLLVLTMIEMLSAA